jgi:antagonist of KipI
MSIHIKHPGFATTVQDLGRFGYGHLGISPAGAADALSFRVANLLVGNHDNAPAIEMTLLGATVEFDVPATVAVTGAECALEIDGVQVPNAEAVHAGSGSVLKCGQLKIGVRNYLAVQGGIDVPLVMGSASTHLGGHFGGFEGRMLRKGDVLRVGNAGASHPRVLRKEILLPAAYGDTTLRVTRGAQQDWFDESEFAKLFSNPYKVTTQSGRTGLRLNGEEILPREATQLLTDGVPLGAIQISQDGQPIVLFVDQQTTGGYPKIANVIAADLHRVGQLRAEGTVRFTEVSMEKAVHLLREQGSWLKEIFESD